MKKSIFSLLIVFVGVLLLTGCGSKSENTAVCTVKLKNSKITSQELSAKLDDEKKVKTIELVVNYSDSESAKSDYESAKSYYGDLIKLNGKKIVISDLQTKAGWKDQVGKTKEEFFTYAKSSAGTEDITCE